MASEQEVLGVKRKYSGQLLRQPWVCGVGVEKDETGQFVLAIHFDPSQPVVSATIPDSIEGCRVKRVASGPFTKQ
jgi:hypothetical protein